MTKRCPACDVVKDEADFYRNRAQPSGLSPYCKPCFQRSNKESAARHPERRAREHRRYVLRNPDKVKAWREQWARRRRGLFAEAYRTAGLAKYYAAHENSPCVYFVGPAGLWSGCIKIGVTENLACRVKTMQNGSPVRLVVYARLDLATKDAALLVESELHKRFAEHRSHGEWFEPALPVVEYVGSLMDSADRESRESA